MKRRISILSPTKASLAARSSDSKCKPQPLSPMSSTRNLQETSELNANVDDKYSLGESYMKNQEHIPLDVFDTCDAMSGDLYICIEHCFDCTRHGMSLRHDQQKYLHVSNLILNQLVQTVWRNKVDFPFLKRVFAFRIRPTSKSRLGALEVTVSYKTRLQHRPKDKKELIQTLRSSKIKETWLTHKIHSKLSSMK